ncbi:MAG: glycoside hydrolase family 9 protein [Treponema sp.]|nr:glycoside hydrolase family 9 protein [Treponema sp.]
MIKIFVNQIGYGTKGLKIAYATGLTGSAESEESFSLLKNESVVFTGKLVLQKEVDRLYNEPVYTADFSEYEPDQVDSNEDVYKIKIENHDESAESYAFKIGDRVFDDIYFSTLNYFYLSRCGEEINGGEWSHKACHTGIAEIYDPESGEKKTKNVQGGWHDAGDYGRYVVAGSKAAMDLLLAYENTKGKWNRFDILKEVRFELEWMLQMQREDGAVYHKISCYHFCPFILPEDEKDVLVLSPVSTAATADFAGCLAYASVVFTDSDPDFSKKLLEAAKKAYSFIENNDVIWYKNPPEITTGGYGDWNVMDECYFAASALFAATKDYSYVEKAVGHKKQSLSIPVDPAKPWMRTWSESFGWGSVAGYGTEILLKQGNALSTNLIKELKESVVQTADTIMEVIQKAAFKTALTKVFWGSNGHACDLAHILLLAYDVTGEEKYFSGAKNQLDYVLGCNPMDVCYVTGEGSNFVKNPHHRPSGAINKTMPGMLSGGPCEDLLDETAKRMLQGQPPLKCFADHRGSYSTNEIAIYWNSTLVHLLARVCF